MLLFSSSFLLEIIVYFTGTCYKPHTTLLFFLLANYLLKKFESRKINLPICLPLLVIFIPFVGLGFLYIFFILPETYLFHFLWFRPTGNEFSQILFVWKFYFTLIFEEYIQCRILVWWGFFHIQHLPFSCFWHTYFLVRMLLFFSLSMCPFFLIYLKTVPLSVVFSSLIIMSWCNFLCDYSAWFYWLL